WRCSPALASAFPGDTLSTRFLLRIGGAEGTTAWSSPPLLLLRRRLAGLRADLLEQRQRVEVVAACLDLVAGEGEEEGSGCLLMPARSRDCSLGGCQRAGVGAVPSHLQGDGVAGGDRTGDRAGRVGERLPPTLAHPD